MLSDDVLSGVIQVTVKGTEITAKLVEKVMKALVEKPKDKNPPLKHGQQSLKQLNRHGAKLDPMDINQVDLKGLVKDLKKYGIDFSVTKGNAPDTSTMFFKTKDAKQFHTAFINYLKRNEIDISPSVKEKARQAFEKANNRSLTKVRVQPLDKGKSQVR
ncbi:PcfB family protein [Aminobacterium colombiense]|jgi:hypothetical protein|uniref:PcfB family protein n=1 Tax=Aminobacterium colombiense TaxID=81468 RepID=UPI0025926211|nr:PcfB family protein [uncultured Aminobacterium sp.]